jgi:hypothetical protein
MFRVFNAFQLTALFAACPYLIYWLSTGPFPYSGAAFWTAIATYVVGFGFNVAGLVSLAEKNRW